MKKLILVALLLLGGCASNPPATNTAGMMENEAIPLDPLMECAANALRVYELPPKIAIMVSCYEEIHALEAWSIDFMERTGLTVEEVDYIIAEESANM